jgi:hypothetical protein
MGDRPMVRHQRRGAALQGVEHRRRELRRPERLVPRHRHGSAQQEHLVVDARQLLQDAGQRGRHRSMGVNDGAGVIAPIDAQVQTEL